MAGYNFDDSVSDTSADFEDRAYTSSISTASRALLPERQESHTNMKNFKVHLQPCATAEGVPVNCAWNAESISRDHCNDTSSPNNFKIPPDPALRDVSAGYSKNPGRSKKRIKFKNNGEFRNSWTDSDDDFREPMFKIPLAQRLRTACEDSCKSSQSASNNTQPVETSYRALPEYSSWQFSADLPYSSRTEELPDLTTNSSTNKDEFGVCGLVDSILDDLSPTKWHQTKRSCDETDSRNPCKIKRKFPEKKHKSSKERSSSTLSSSAFATECTSDGAGSVNEAPADIVPDVFAGLWDDPVDNIGTSSLVRHHGKPKVSKTEVLCGGSRAQSGVGSNTEKRRFRQKRQTSGNDCFNETFNMIDDRAEETGRSFHSHLLSSFPHSSMTDAPEFPETLPDARPRKGNAANAKKLDDAIAGHSRSSYEHSGIADLNADRISKARSPGRDVKHRRERGKKTAAVVALGNDPLVAESNVSSACSRPESAILSKQKKLRLRHKPTNSGVSSNDIALQQYATLDLDANSVVIRAEHSENSDTISRMISFPDTSIRQNSTQDTRDRGQGRSRGTGVASNRSDKGQLDRLKRLTRRIQFDEDRDDADDEMPVLNHGESVSGRNASRHDTDSALSSNIDVVVIDSDNEETESAEPVHLNASLFHGQQGAEIETDVTPPHDSNSGSSCERNLPRARLPKTARMSCGG